MILKVLLTANCVPGYHFAKVGVWYFQHAYNCFLCDSLRDVSNAVKLRKTLSFLLIIFDTAGHTQQPRTSGLTRWPGTVDALSTYYHFPVEIW